MGAFSDLPCDGDPWREPKALERCESCVACLRNCPTGAITRDRFLLRAERCLTYHNEAAGDFPGWIDPSWHHCLIGCLRCQTACPENKAVLEWFEDRAEFSGAGDRSLSPACAAGSAPYGYRGQDEEPGNQRGLPAVFCRNLSMIVGRDSRVS